MQPHRHMGHSCTLDHDALLYNDRKPDLLCFWYDRSHLHHIFSSMSVVIRSARSILSAVAIPACIETTSKSALHL
jgi:hypothetical protein